MVEVGFEPLAPGAHAAELGSTDTAEQAAWSVRLDAIGVDGTRVTDAGVVDPPQPPHDVLFLIDRSCNVDFIRDLATEVPRLIRAGDDVDADLRIAAAVADDTCLVPESQVLHGGSEDPEGDFLHMADPEWDQVRGVADENRQFLLAQRAFAARGDGACLDDFWRADSRWHVVHLADRDDTSSLSVAEHLAVLGRHRRDDRFMVHAIVGEPPHGCASALPGQRYAESATRTGGAIASLCGPMKEAVDRIADHALAFRGVTVGSDGRMPLSQQPVEATLEVTLAGVPVPSDAWRYEPDGQAIRLLPEVVRTPGAAVEVTYVVQPTCE